MLVIFVTCLVAVALYGAPIGALMCGVLIRRARGKRRTRLWIALALNILAFVATWLLVLSGGGDSGNNTVTILRAQVEQLDEISARRISSNRTSRSAISSKRDFEWANVAERTPERQQVSTGHLREVVGTFHMARSINAVHG